jgi:hypothetical protein
MAKIKKRTKAQNKIRTRLNAFEDEWLLNKKEFSGYQDFLQMKLIQAEDVVELLKTELGTAETYIDIIGKIGDFLNFKKVDK